MIEIALHGVEMHRKLTPVHFCVVDALFADALMMDLATEYLKRELTHSKSFIRWILLLDYLFANGPKQTCFIERNIFPVQADIVQPTVHNVAPLFYQSATHCTV